MKKKLTIAFMGLSKGGKTSFINSLSYNPLKMLPVHASNEARTKITVNYEYVPYTNNYEVLIKNIKWNYPRIACSGDYKNFDEYNKNVRENEFYKKLGLREIDCTDNMYSNLKDQLSNIEANISINDVISLINMEGIDEYITTLKIEVPANEYLSSILKENEMTLVFRDTRGLLDLIIEDGKNNTKNIHMKPLSELGLDGIDAIIFMSGGNFQDSIAKIYKRMLRIVMNAVPIFLTYEDESIRDIRINTVESAKNIIDKEKFSGDEYRFEERFFDVLEFFENIGIVNNIEGSIEFSTFNYFNKCDIEYLFPKCDYLSKIKMRKSVKENPLDDDSYVNYTYFTSYIIGDIIKKLLEYYNDIYKSLVGDLLDSIRNHIFMFKEDVCQDFRKYINADSQTSYVRPRVTYSSYNDISKKMCDKKVEILGTYNGITTMNGNEMKYIAPAVLGVTMEKALREWINKPYFYDNMKSISNLIDCKEKDRVIKTIKKALSYVLQKRLVDYWATIQGYNFINRHIIKDNIEEIREKNISEDYAIYEYAGFILEYLCKELEKIKEEKNEAVWNLIVDCGKNYNINY